MSFFDDLRRSRKRRALAKAGRLHSAELAALRDEMDREGWECAFGGFVHPPHLRLKDIAGTITLTEEDRAARAGSYGEYRGDATVITMLRNSQGKSYKENNTND